MRHVIASILILSTFASAPAHASFVPQRTRIPPRPHALPSINQVGTGTAPLGDIGEVRDQIRGARKAGLITKGEARRLRGEADAIERSAESFGRNGISDDEAAEIEARTRYLRDAVGRSALPPSSGH